MKLSTVVAFASQITSHPARGAWIEIRLKEYGIWNMRSHPARGAWIEISILIASQLLSVVAPRKGCVD